MPVDIEHARRLFTAEEFERMDSAGVFNPEERLELIDGEIVEMSPVGPGSWRGYRVSQQATHPRRR